MKPVILQTSQPPRRRNRRQITICLQFFINMLSANGLPRVCRHTAQPDGEFSGGVVRAVDATLDVKINGPGPVNNIADTLRSSE